VQIKKFRAHQFAAIQMTRLDDKTFNLFDRVLDGIEFNKLPPLEGFAKPTKQEYEVGMCQKGKASYKGYYDALTNHFRSWATLKKPQLRKLLNDLLDGTWARWIKQEKELPEDDPVSAR
jgi:hypothetical protein